MLCRARACLQEYTSIPVTPLLFLAVAGAFVYQSRQRKKLDDASAKVRRSAQRAARVMRLSVHPRSLAGFALLLARAVVPANHITQLMEIQRESAGGPSRVGANPLGALAAPGMASSSELTAAGLRQRRTTSAAQAAVDRGRSAGRITGGADAALQARMDRLAGGTHTDAATRAGIAGGTWRAGDSLAGDVPPQDKRDAFKGDAKWFKEGAAGGGMHGGGAGAAKDVTFGGHSEHKKGEPGHVEPARVPEFVRVTPSGRRVYMGRSKDRVASMRKRAEARRERRAVASGDDAASGGGVGGDDSAGAGAAGAGAIATAGSGTSGGATGAGVTHDDARKANKAMMAVDEPVGAGGGARAPSTSTASISPPPPAAATTAPAGTASGGGFVTGSGSAVVTDALPPEWRSIGGFLESVGTPQYQPLFEAEALTDVRMLLEMCEDNPADLKECLKEVGVDKVGHRQAIVRALSREVKKNA